MEDKVCRYCSQLKPRERFGSHPRAVDGLSGKCKDCQSADARRRRAERPEIYRAINRRHNRTEKKRAAQREYRRKKRQSQPEETRAYDRKYRESPINLLKHKARIVLGRAVREGQITRQACEKCNDVGEGHHDDYSKPLEVRWLCKTHHAEHHRKFN